MPPLADVSFFYKVKTFFFRRHPIIPARRFFSENEKNIEKLLKQVLHVLSDPIWIIYILL